jgi:hypothetical protein
VGPEAAGEEIEAAVVAANLIAAEHDPVLVADEELASLIPAGADLSHHPARRAAIEREVGECVEHPLEAAEVLRVAAHVRADPGDLRISLHHA